jgi:hypothetical protein
MSLAIPFLRAGSPIAHKQMTNKEKDEYQNKQRSKEYWKEVVDWLETAIRAKPQWYFKILQQKELADKWVKEAGIEAGDDSDGLLRYVELVFCMRAGCSDVHVSWFRDLKAEARRICILDHTIQLQSPHLDERPVDFDNIVSDIGKACLYLRSSVYGIDTPRMHEDVGAYYSDDVVPKSLHREVMCTISAAENMLTSVQLVKELDALAATEPKDYHPGSGGQVQDLIHPSLCEFRKPSCRPLPLHNMLNATFSHLPDPYMADVTLINDWALPPRTYDGKFATMMDPGYPHKKKTTLESAFAWIPTVFKISEDGQRVEIQDYINGLGPREHFPVLYQLIEQVFRIAIPMLEKTLAHTFEAVEDNPSSEYCQTNCLPCIKIELG